MLTFLVFYLILGATRLHFGSPGALFLDPWISAQVVEMWLRCQLRRFDPLLAESFCRSCLWVRSDDEVLQILVIFLLF